MSTSALSLAPLVACEVAAGNRVTGRLAYTLWLVGTHCGWQHARSQLSRSRFFEQLSVIRKAGLDAPDGKALRQLEAAEQPPVYASPFAQVLQMPGQRFSVRQDIDDEFTAGVECVCDSVVFRGSLWFASITRDAQGSYTEVLLRDFLQRTQPVSPAPQAAN